MVGETPKKSVPITNLSVEEIDLLAKKIGNDPDVIQFVASNHQILTRFEQTRQKPSKEEWEKHHQIQGKYVDNVKVKYPEWDRLPHDDRNLVINKALKIAANTVRSEK